MLSKNDYFSESVEESSVSSFLVSHILLSPSLSPTDTHSHLSLKHSHSLFLFCPTGLRKGFNTFDIQWIVVCHENARFRQLDKSILNSGSAFTSFPIFAKTRVERKICFTLTIWSPDPSLETNIITLVITKMKFEFFHWLKLVSRLKVIHLKNSNTKHRLNHQGWHFLTYSLWQ